MQFQGEANKIGENNRFRSFICVEEDHHAFGFGIELTTLPVENYHDDEGLLLVWTDVIELHPFLDFCPCS